MTSRLTLLVSLFIFPFVFNFHSARSQDLDTVAISGRVADQNGAVIPGAEVEATLSKRGLTRKTTSNAEGRYRLIQLEPGNYLIRISATGFATQYIENVATISGQSLQFDATLIPSTVIVEPVVVTTAETSVVDTKRTVTGTTLNLLDTKSLPLVTRSVLDLVFTLPGVTEEPLSTRDLAEDRNTSAASTPEEAGIFSLAGAPAYSNNLTIDGLDNNDDRAARERFQPSLEAVAEVQVITNQFSAEYGRASGGRVNLRTRSGSKDFHTSAFHYFRDEALDANTFRNNSLGLSRLPLQEHVVGFTASGPVFAPRKHLALRKLEHTVFFVSYELNKTLDSALIDTLVPLEQTGVYPLPRPTHPAQSRLEDVDEPALAAEVAPFIAPLSTPFKNTSITVRVDHQFSETHNASIVHQAGRLMNLRQFGGVNRLADALQARRRNSDAISYSDNFVFSARLVNQLRFQYSRLAPSFAAQGGNKPVVLISLNDPAVSGVLTAGSSTLGGSDRRENRIQLQEILSVVNGDHSLKVGADVHHVRSTFIDLTDLTGTFSFASAGDFLAGVPSRYRQNFQSSSTQKSTYIGLFFQDEWQLHPSLLLSYGLRYERETILHDLNNVGPRFSIAFAPTESFVVRAGGGIFYNRPLLRTIDDFTLGQQQLFFDTDALTDPLTHKLLTREQRRAFIAANIRFPQTLALDSHVVQQFGVLNTDFSRRLDPSLRIPESYQLNAGVERDLGNGYSVEANFTFTRGIHLWREFNANAPVLPNGYNNFSEFLASRDFANFASPLTAARPLHNAGSAGELVRFQHGSLNPANPNAVTRVIEFGVPVSVMNLNSSSSTMLNAALTAINHLRPDPSRGELEQLVSVGNSFYRAVTVELRKRFSKGKGFGGLGSGFLGVGNGFTFRAGYTLSSLVDDGVVNTSDALVPGDFRAERARSLLDRRHRFVLSGSFALPGYLTGLTLSPIWRVASEAPFNISLGGTDRNLDDVSNDRPNYSGDLRLLKWRKPGESLDPRVVAAFSLPVLGQSGNLPRNAGRGPGLFVFDLNVTREFHVKRFKLRTSLEFDNVLNKTVFSFGSEFINFASGSNDSFLLATRTGRPRQLQLGLKVEF